MHNVSQKFELFGDGNRALQEMKKFHGNLNLIREKLFELTDLITHGGSGHLNDILRSVQK